MKGITTIGILLVKINNDIKFLIKNNSVQFSRIVKKNETVRDSVIETFVDLGLDVSDLDATRFKMIDLKERNLEIYYVLETELESLLNFISIQSELKIGETEEEIVEEIKKKIEGNL